MLKELSVKNFTVIESITLAADEGMTVITGETGAGKSLLIDALNLALGARSSAAVIREGAKCASITLNIALRKKSIASAWLSQNGFPETEDCVLHRVIGRNGKSRCWINGIPSTSSQLRILGYTLVDIFGQNSQQLLLRRENHLPILDAICEHSSMLEKMKKTASSWNRCSSEREALKQNRKNLLNRIELLQYRANDMGALAPKEDEYENLEKEHRFLSRQERLKTCLSETMTHLDESHSASCVAQLASLARGLREFTGLCEEIDSSIELLEEAIKQARVANEEIHNYVDKIDFASHFLEVEARLANYHRLAIKYDVKPQDICQLWQSAQKELDQLEEPGDRLREIEEMIQKLEETWLQLASKVSKNRKRLKTKVESEVTTALRKLNMANANIEVKLSERELSGNAQVHEQGLESAEFLVCTNPEQKPGAIAKIASGGELSRISLAFQLVSSQAACLPIMVFDEADTGIGGASAETVGLMLREIGRRTQVFCVTHLPQVAAHADHHYTVSKSLSGGRAKTEVTKLDAQARKQEIARMMAGRKITDIALSHAKEMLQATKQAKIQDSYRDKGT